MKKIFFPLTIIALAFLLTGCPNKGARNNEENNAADTSTVADTGFTGIKQYLSGNFLTYEVEFRNGVRNGLMKTYYPSGKLRQTFIYKNGMREDTAIWYHEDGVIFRKTAFRNDSMNGLQIQYYKSGRVRAKLDYVNGLRKPYLEEFRDNGSRITDYPSVLVKTKDDYNSNGTFRIDLSLSKPDVKVTFYRGEYENGLFNPKTVRKINTSETTGSLMLTKGSSKGKGYVGIIAEISTSLGNKQLVYNKVTLPYNDLN